MMKKPIAPRIADAELALLIRQRHQKGAEALYDTYANFLFLAIIRIVPERSLAEKVLETTFTRIWCAIDDYVIERERLYTWMIAIARNAALDALAPTTSNYETKREALYAGKR